MENIDIDFPAERFNNRNQVLQKYVTALNQFRLLAEQLYQVRPLAFDNYVFFQYFQTQSDLDDSAYNSRASFSPFAFLKLEVLKHILDRRRQILCWLLYLTLICVICVFAYRHETCARLADRVQYMIYPGMKIWRRMTLPIIKRFPQLTEFYDESCLMKNPFFQIENLNCDLCASVESVVDVTRQADFANVHAGKGDAENAHETPAEFVPLIFKINQRPIQLEDVFQIYKSDRETFQRDAYRVQSSNSRVTNLDELFDEYLHLSQKSANPPEAHNLWRCNRMLPARLLRKMFKRPERLPSTGQAPERFVTIDTPQAPTYALPNVECAKAYIQQALGARFIIMRPTSECRHRCRTLSLRLPESHVLTYNLWYWKPISVPDPGSETFSISLIGSYC